MKILMICTEKLPLPPIRGGAIQTYIAGALPYLKEKHDITVLGVNDPDLPDEEIIDGIRYIRVPGKLFEIYQEGVTRFVKSESFDLIHIFNRPRLVLPVRKVAPHSKITLSMHNDMFKLEKIDPEEATLALNEVSGIATVSDYIGNLIESQYPQAKGKHHTIYSGVDTDRFLPGNSNKMRVIRNSIRQENGLEDKTVILYAGRLSRNKGVDRLIRALPELSKRHKDLALVIIGSNWFSQDHVTDYVAYVRALAKKSPVPVITTGYVSNSEIHNWFAAADLFVCTSVWQEPLARVHYEAMSAGLPIVTTNRGGNAEVIELGENGYLVETPEDPSQFVGAIDRLLSRPELMKRMGEKGRELALSQYTWDRVASDILNMWELAELSSIQTQETPQFDEVIDHFAEDAQSEEVIEASSEENDGDDIQPEVDEELPVGGLEAIDMEEEEEEEEEFDSEQDVKIIRMNDRHNNKRTNSKIDSKNKSKTDHSIALDAEPEAESKIVVFEKKEFKDFVSKQIPLKQTKLSQYRQKREKTGKSNYLLRSDLIPKSKKQTVIMPQVIVLHQERD